MLWPASATPGLTVKTFQLQQLDINENKHTHKEFNEKFIINYIGQWIEEEEEEGIRYFSSTLRLPMHLFIPLLSESLLHCLPFSLPFKRSAQWNSPFQRDGVSNRTIPKEAEEH